MWTLSLEAEETDTKKPGSSLELPKTRVVRFTTKFVDVMIAVLYHQGNQPGVGMTPWWVMETT